jgi:subfamily B ATP-binding cassette protein MsbA
MEKKAISFILQIYKKYWYLFLLALIGAVLEAGALSGFIYILKNIIDDIFIQKDIEKFRIIVILLLILALGKQLGYFLKDFIFPLIIYKYEKELREKIYNRFLLAELSVINKYPIGDLVSRATNDISRFVEILSALGTNIITEFFTIIGIIALLIYLDWKMFLILVILIPILAYVLNYFGEKRKKYSRLVQESLAEYTQHLNQILSGLETAKLFDFNMFKKIFTKINEKLFHREKKNKFYETMYLSAVEILAYAGTIGIILFGGYRVIKGELTTGQFFSFLGGVLVLVNSMQVLQRGLVHLKGISPVIDRIEFLLNIPQEKDGNVEFKQLKEKIEYKNVYVELGGKKILKNINLTIPKKIKLGIVGLSGSGKTTLIKLLPRLIKDYKGSIKIDNVEIKDYKLSSLRKNIGVLSQEVFIFNDTLRNNLLIAKPDATEEELYKALEKAKADFVKNLPNGLDTILGEKGSILSGGERQRLAIARLFLKNPEILIIDEGTSALDLETEDYVISEIEKHFRDKTIILITHRLSILKITDLIIVMENGKIIERGGVAELKAKGGLFTKFVELANREIEKSKA